jgi:hypothetical protein
MSNIIYQIFENYIIDVMGFHSSNKIRNSKNWSELKKNLQPKRAQVSTYCEIIDEAIFKDRAGREKKRIVAETRETRGNYIHSMAMQALAGEITGKNRWDIQLPVDEVMGIESYDRVIDTVRPLWLKLRQRYRMQRAVIMYVTGT